MALQQDLETYWPEHGLSGWSARTIQVHRDGVRPLTDRLGARPLRKLSAADVRSALSGNSSWPVVPIAPVHVRYGLTERGRDLFVALRVLVRWGSAANR